MLSQIKNAQKAKKKYICFRKSNVIILLLNILWIEGFILSYIIDANNKNFIKIFLKYKDKIPLITNLKLISKPNLKLYCTVKDLWKINCNSGLIVSSTNKGLLSINSCRKLNIGGELVILIK